MPGKRRESDDILADLHARRESLASPDGGVPLTEAGYLTQQITAHETLARLREERAERVKAKEATADVDAQITFWLTMADEHPMESPEVGVSLPEPAAQGLTVEDAPKRKRG